MATASYHPSEPVAVDVPPQNELPQPGPLSDAKRAIAGFFETPVPKDAKEGFRTGLRAVSAGMKAAGSAVVTAPIQGARQNGVKGFAKGLVTGMASLAVPVTALGIGAMQVARGTLNQIEAKRSGKVWNEKQRQWVEVTVEVEDESELPPIELLDDCPPLFICPITQDVMRDPVVASDGFTYERAAIEAWLKKHTTSPLTGAQLTSKAVVPNNVVRTACKEWLEEKMREQEAAECQPQEGKQLAEEGERSQPTQQSCTNQDASNVVPQSRSASYQEDCTACIAPRTHSMPVSRAHPRPHDLDISSKSMPSAHTLSYCFDSISDRSVQPVKPSTHTTTNPPSTSSSSACALSDTSQTMDSFSDFTVTPLEPNIHSPTSSMDATSQEDLVLLDPLGHLVTDVCSPATSGRPTVTNPSVDLLGSDSGSLATSRSRASSTAPLGDLLIWDDVAGERKEEKTGLEKQAMAAAIAVQDSLI